MGNTSQIHIDAAKRHPIRVAARRSGTPETTLRAWERRYEAVNPGRAETGRRLYSDRDIERLRLIRRALDGGRSISAVANLSKGQLLELIQEDESARAAIDRSRHGSSDLSAEIVDECMSAVRNLNARLLTATLGRATRRLPALLLIEDVIAPLLHKIGDYWYANRLSPRHEHLASNVIRSILTQLQLGTLGDASRTIVVATPSGQRHDLGTQFVAALAVTEGWSVVNLGADVPAVDIALAATESKAKMVALSLVHPLDDPGVDDALSYLGTHLDEDVELIVGGRGAEAYSGSIRAAGAREIHSSRALAELLGSREEH